MTLNRPFTVTTLKILMSNASQTQQEIIDPSTPAIELANLSQRFGSNYILEDISLTIQQGKRLCLQGSNGSGKTTLLRVLSSKLRPSKGEGFVLGHSLKKQADEVRKHIAYLSVLGGSYPNLTAQENLEMAAKFYGYKSTDAKEQSKFLLDKVDLSSATNKLVRTFSSGMKKRLGIARVLLADAPIWLLDEPYAALDASGRDMIDELLSEAVSSNKTVVLASHELARVKEFVDVTLLVDQGRLSRIN